MNPQATSKWIPMCMNQSIRVLRKDTLIIAYCCLFHTKIYPNRRLRNRLAQRAFRRRQTNRLKELRDRVDLNDKPYDETVKTLQEENSRLRRNLVEVQSNLARLIATMQKLSGTVSDALCGPPQNDPSRGQADYQASGAPTTPISSSEEPDLRVKGYGLTQVSTRHK
jgi:hypothetical protein